MVIMGNPPYSGESANKGEWIMKLMEDYKKEPGGKERLNERNPKWINDDYVKFLRYGQYFIERNGSGILAFINPHGFLANPTFRGMRWNLLKTYDKIYTIDLHGNSNKQESNIDGTADVNVFDIQQGVSINLFIKTGRKKETELGKVFHFDLFGKREFKYDFLLDNKLSNIDYKEIPIQAPMYLFSKRNYTIEDLYNKGFSVNDLFVINGVGITTAHDEFVIKDKVEDLILLFKEFQNTERNEQLLHNKFNVNKKEGWKILNGYDNIKGEKDLTKFIKPIAYRPFDNRYIFYEDKLVWRTVRKVMQNFLNGENIGLITARSNKSESCDHFFISKSIMETKCGERTTQSAIFPIYIIHEKNNQLSLGQTSLRTPNLKLEIVNQIAEGIGLKFTPEKESKKGTFAPIDILDYIYAVLHSPTYREKYKEFLKIDFPRVPYPKDVNTFWKLVSLGGELRQIHLLESPEVDQYITKYPIDGDNEVGKIKYEGGNVYINETQYFANVPETAWSFYIGGYQPAQKWLKDRKGRKLEFDDILHYQKIIVALSATDRLMKEIDKIDIE